MVRLPARLALTTLGNLFKKPAAPDPAQAEAALPPHFRGRLSYQPELCNGCGECVRACPSAAIEVSNAGYREAPSYECRLDLGRCLQCGQCAERCRRACLKLTAEPLPPLSSRHQLRVKL